MKELKIVVINTKENIAASVIKDTISTALIVIAFYLNYHYLGNSLVLQIVFGIVFIGVLLKLGGRRKNEFKDKQKAKDYIDSL